MCKFSLILIDADLSLEPRILKFENFVFEIPAFVVRREEGIRKNFTTEDTEKEAREENSEALLFDAVKIKELEKARAWRLVIFFVCAAAVIAVFAYFALLLMKQRKN
jgi:hypothetical protein